LATKPYPGAVTAESCCRLSVTRMMLGAYGSKMTVLPPWSIATGPAAGPTLEDGCCAGEGTASHVAASSAATDPATRF
jgi:hypothetical protein